MELNLYIIVNNKEIEEKRQCITNRFAEWTSHNIHLQDDVYTYDRSHPKFEHQLTGHGFHVKRILQNVADAIKQPLNELRVLDLACLEGIYGIEFARQGAEVVGIEGREENIEKARFAKEVLKLDNITFTQDDVRNLSVEKYGKFDVVLCLGIFYHINAPDVFDFAKNISEVCRQVLILDTHFGVLPNESHIYKEQQYYGWTFTEHSPTETKEQRLKKMWASLDNETSFWLTRPSLYNLLSNVGFTSVLTCQNPVAPSQWTDRETIMAIKGRRQNLYSTPAVNDLPAELWSEEIKATYYPSQQDFVETSQRTFFGRVRNFAKRVLR